MLWKNRGQGRSFRIEIPLLYGLLILLASCTGSPARRDTKANPIDPTLILHYEKAFVEYVAALLLLDSKNPVDRFEAGQKLEALSFSYFSDDRLLLRTFLSGTPADSETARKELARRGTMLDTVKIFTEPYSRVVWEGARKKMISLGEDSRSFMVVSLLRLLINRLYKETWPQLRHQLVECGGIALETTAELARKKADASPTTAIWKQDDLVQLVMVLATFGNPGRPFLEKLAAYPNGNVRKAVATAIGKSLSGEYLDLLETLISTDPDWQVKAAAAEALGHFRFLRNRVGKFLLVRIQEEKDKFVLHKIILAMGRIHYTKGIPRMVQLLELPDSDTVGVIMEALYDLTGERLTTPIAWQKWYRDDYPAWIRKRENP